MGLAGAARTVANRIVFGVTQVVGQLGIERSLGNGLSQLLEQSGGTQNVLGSAVVLEQFVEQPGELGVVLEGHGRGHCGVSPLGYGEEQ